MSEARSWSAILGLVLLAVSAAHAETAGNAASGRGFALEVCTPCHNVTRDQPSTSRSAIVPDFPAIANAPAMTETALHAFLSTPHPHMPNLILTAQEQDDVIAYILTFRTRP